MTNRSRASFLSTIGVCAGSVAMARPARAQAPTAVRIGGLVADTYAEWIYGRDSGIFARNGFTIDGTQLNNGGAVMAAMSGGSLDLGIADLIAGVNAMNAGVPVVLLAAGGVYTSADASIGGMLVVAKDSPVRGPRDLAGKVIGIPTLVGLTSACLRAWLPQNGVELSSVKIVEIPPTAAIAAVLRGTLDCVLTGEPFYTPNKSNLRDAGHPLDVIGKAFYLNAWYASKSWVDADRDRAKRVVNAIYETARWANSHRPETFDMLTRQAKFDPDKMRGMGRATFARAMDVGYVQVVLNLAAQQKIFDRLIDANSIIVRF